MRFVFVTPGDSMHALPWVEEFSSTGHEVVVYAYPPITVEWGPSRIREVVGAGPMQRARWLWTAVHHDEPDVIVMHYAGTDLFLLSHLSVPVVASVWGSDILRDLQGHAVKRVLLEGALRRAALVVSPAAHMTRHLETAGVEPGRILTVQYGVDVSAFRVHTDPRPAPVRVISTRSFAPVYRVGDLVDAATMVDRGLVMRVILVGTGPLEEQLHRQATEQGLQDMLEFVGRLDNEGIAQELHEADIYVSTSESDGASISLLEAMASGLPCVVTDIAANREWIDESCGMRFPVGDPKALAGSIEKLAADPALRQSMGVAARSRVAARGDRRANMDAIRRAVEGLRGLR